MKAFDQILRYGVLSGYAHTGEKVRIAEFLVKRITDLVNEMGIASVKHLKVRKNQKKPLLLAADVGA